MLKSGLNTVTVSFPVIHTEEFVEVTEEVVLNGVLVEWFRRRGFFAYPAYDFNTKELVGIRYNRSMSSHTSPTAPLGDYVAVSKNEKVHRITASFLQEQQEKEEAAFKEWQASREV